VNERHFWLAVLFFYAGMAWCALVLWIGGVL